MSNPARHWQFTLNSPINGGFRQFDDINAAREFFNDENSFNRSLYSEWIDALCMHLESAANVKAYVFSVECGSGTNRIHLQGHLVLHDKKRRKQVKDVFGDNTVHVEIARSPKKSIEYAQKTDDPTFVKGPYKGGDEDSLEGSQQGRRTDLASAAASILEGKRMWEVAELHPTTFIKYHKGMQALMEVKRRRKAVQLMDQRVQGLETPTLTVTALWGAAGSGKTWHVYKTHGADAVFQPTYGTDRIWWEGYDGEPVLLLDEVSQKVLSYNNLLRLLDNYPTTEERKGSSVVPLLTHIYLTSNMNPDGWWDEFKNYPEIWSAFVRRCTGGIWHYERECDHGLGCHEDACIVKTKEY